MNTLKLVVFATGLMIGAAALADVEEKREMKIVIQDASFDDSASFHWVSDESGFDMENMQVGETHSIVDESGRSVLITRAEEGFQFDIDGKTIVVPDMGAHGMHTAFVDGSDVAADVDIEIIGNHQMMSGHDASGVTVISGEPLDASTKESIKSVLVSAGRDDDVTFIDGSGGSEGRHMRIIKKKIEIAQ